VPIVPSDHDPDIEEREGHAGAIVSDADESASAKKKVMRESGIHVVDSPATIGAKVKEVLG
jgi:succinyl-CoA synthetase alpha subunit